MVPRAGLDKDSIDRMLDLYFGLLRQAGITRKMLARAAEAYVMAPTKGKSRWFPDPGQLAEMCAEEASERRKALAGLQRGLEVLDEDPRDTLEAEGKAFDAAAHLRKLGEQLRTKGSRGPLATEPEIPVFLSTARSATDAAELAAHINSKMHRG